MNSTGARGKRLLLPPGPADNVVAQTVGFHRDPLRYLRSCQEALGDVFTLRLLTVRPTVVVADPAAVLPLQEADPGSARAGAARREVLPFAPAPSVFSGDGEAHAGPQRRVAPALAAEAMAARRPAMAEIAARHAGQWPRGRPFQLLPRLRAVTDEIFVRLVLGVREEEIVTALTGSIQRMLRTPGNPPSTLPGEGDGLAGALGRGAAGRASGSSASERARPSSRSSRDPVPAAPPPATSASLRKLTPEPEPMGQRATVLVPKRGLLVEAAGRSRGPEVPNPPPRAPGAGPSRSRARSGQDRGPCASRPARRP